MLCSLLWGYGHCGTSPGCLTHGSYGWTGQSNHSRKCSRTLLQQGLMVRTYVRTSASKHCCDSRPFGMQWQLCWQKMRQLHTHILWVVLRCADCRCMCCFVLPCLQPSHAAAVPPSTWLLHCICLHDLVLGDSPEGLCSHVQPPHCNCDLDISFSVHEVSKPWLTFLHISA